MPLNGHLECRDLEDEMNTPASTTTPPPPPIITTYLDPSLVEYNHDKNVVNIVAREPFLIEHRRHHRDGPRVQR